MGMNTEAMIRELRRLSDKHKNDRVDTFATNWSVLCSDIANKLEELRKYECMLSNNFLTKLETIEPRPTEVIVFYFDADRAPLEELQVMFEIAQREFPNNQIVFISDKLNLVSWDKDALEDQIGMLNEILEKL